MADEFHYHRNDPLQELEQENESLRNEETERELKREFSRGRQRLILVCALVVFILSTREIYLHGFFEKHAYRPKYIPVGGVCIASLVVIFLIIRNMPGKGKIKNRKS